MGAIRKGLDGLYLFSGVLAALCLIVILVLIVLQMTARLMAVTEFIPGGPDISGYAMAAASFLAFAHALNRGSHIRVSILLNAVKPSLRRVFELWCFGLGTLITWYFVWYAGKFVYWSWKFKDISQGQDKTLLWMPQSLMLFGAGIFAIAMTDHLVSVIRHGDHRIVRDLEDQSHGE